MSRCIFCKIVEGKEPASVVYEDEAFLALMDAYPLAPGHCLVIPKKHVERLDELSTSERNRLFEIGHAIVEAQKACGYGLEGTNLLLNDGKAANQTVPHAHLHLIPRKKGDFLRSIPKLFLHVTGLFGIQTSRQKLDELANTFKDKLSI